MGTATAEVPIKESMANQKKKPAPKPDPEEQQEEQTSAGRPPRGYPIHSFQVRLPVALHKQLLIALSRSRRTQNAEVQIAIEKHLETMGLWPVPTNGAH